MITHGPRQSALLAATSQAFGPGREGGGGCVLFVLLDPPFFDDQSEGKVGVKYDEIIGVGSYQCSNTSIPEHTITGDHSK